MPKIIENLENNLIREAGKQIRESGYGALTVRSVAKACGVGVGTVYNYFPSKDNLVAACMLEDWNGCMEKIRKTSEGSDSPEPVVRCIYDQLLEYASRQQGVLRDEAAASAFAGSFSRYHGLLRRQLAQPLEKFFPSPFDAEFIAEALLTWTMAGTDYQEIFRILSRLF